MKREYEAVKDLCVMSALRKNKKANFGEMSVMAKSLVTFGIMIGIGLIILGRFKDTTTVGTIEYNEIGNVQTLFSDLTTWGGIVLIVMIAYLVLRYLGVFDQG